MPQSLRAVSAPPLRPRRYATRTPWRESRQRRWRRACARRRRSARPDCARAAGTHVSSRSPIARYAYASRGRLRRRRKRAEAGGGRVAAKARSPWRPTSPRSRSVIGTRARDYADGRAVPELGLRTRPSRHGWHTARVKYGTARTVWSRVLNWDRTRPGSRTRPSR
jgi:hypothetical protein